MSAGAQARGAVGVIISGRCRDVNGHRTLAFPVFFSRGRSTLGQSPFTRPSAINVPLTIFPEGVGKFPDVTIHPGNWMIANGDGVVCVTNALQAQGRHN